MLYTASVHEMSKMLRNLLGWLDKAVAYAETGNMHVLRSLQAMADEAVDVRIEAAIGHEFGRPIMLIEYIGEAIGKRAMVNLDHDLDGDLPVSWAELGADPTARLRTVALARPQLLIIEDIPVSTLAPAPDPEAADEGAGP